MLETLHVTANNLLSPAILFFVLGALAVFLKSDLNIPREVTSGLALYLMLSIGFRGGYELGHAGLTPEALGAGLGGVALGLTLPAVAFLILTRVGRLDPVNAGAIAAHYGSISAVTFVTGQTFLTHLGTPYQGFMVAVMALMEAPGIVSGILLARVFGKEQGNGNGNGNDHGNGHENGKGALGALVREAVFGGSVLVLMGSFAVGLLSGEKGMELLKPFVSDLFPGALALFLLDMGLSAARRLGDFMRLGGFLAGFGLTMPLIGGTLGVVAASLAGLGVGDATLMAALAASGSYIAAPAAVRLALPQANPSLSITLSLGVTFPFNILVGIPLYYTIAAALIGS